MELEKKTKIGHWKLASCRFRNYFVFFFCLSNSHVLCQSFHRSFDFIERACLIRPNRVVIMIEAIVSILMISKCSTTKWKRCVGCLCAECTAVRGQMNRKMIFHFSHSSHFCSIVISRTSLSGLPFVVGIRIASYRVYHFDFIHFLSLFSSRRFVMICSANRTIYKYFFRIKNMKKEENIPNWIAADIFCFAGK